MPGFDSFEAMFGGFKPPFKPDSTLERATSKEVTETRRSRKPIDLTADKLQGINDPQLNKLNEAVTRLRVVIEQEDGTEKTIGSGSGIVISPDGLVLSVNHVPAIGTQNSSGFISGTQVLKNLSTWGQLLTKGKAKLVADIVIPPEGPALPSTMFTPKSVKSVVELFPSNKVTNYDPTDDTVKTVTVPLQIITEDPGHDLMLARIDLPEKQDPYSFLNLANTKPTRGQDVYSLGHPLGIKHNSLALGEVIDPNFDVDKIKRALESHANVVGAIAGALNFNIPGKTLLQGALLGLSQKLAGVDVSTAHDFLNGATISSNHIDHGSSGGLLADKDGKVVGVTYLGLPNSLISIMRYIAGALDLRPASGEPLNAVTGSVGLDKVHRFLDEAGVDLNRLNDGKAAGTKELLNRNSQRQAADTIRLLLTKQGKTGTEIEEELSKLGLIGNSAKTAKKTEEVKPEYKVFSFKSPHEPIEVLALNVSKSDTQPGKIEIQITVKLINGETLETSDFVDPIKFDPDKVFDPKTKDLVYKHLTETEDGKKTLEKLSSIQQEILSPRELL